MRVFLVVLAAVLLSDGVLISDGVMLANDRAGLDPNGGVVRAAGDDGRGIDPNGGGPRH